MQQPKKGQLRQTHISQISVLSNHLLRISLSGEALIGFPEDAAGDYFKLFICEPNEQPTMQSIKRSYTIKEFSSVNQTLIFDAVINRHNGPATNWVRQAKVGDTAYIAGPGPKKLVTFNASQYILIGDITSVNAIRQYLTLIHSAAKVDVYIMAPTEQDKQAYLADRFCAQNPNQQVHWLVSEEQTINNQTLLQAIQQHEQLKPDTQVFMACEASCVRQIKSYLTENLNLPRQQIAASAYWKQGLNSDQLSIEKRAEQQ
ncbi:siderophore-interacting protein [Catenovulum sp. 2E275]|uniref:siderophore-interacting protein n=1 Tax=Catenovulum sp. 2E275 TaxID=2980497 RepID=UPI0021D3B803|nr:siderophore-interacting protein [Catenovulum sp. 2E275]MCU4675246.1 siderophore-interacting protein [Catenovulum sp. 2E275]